MGKKRDYIYIYCRHKYVLKIAGLYIHILRKSVHYQFRFWYDHRNRREAFANPRPIIIICNFHIFI